MRRELHVRFCEGGGVRFRYPTHRHRSLERAMGLRNFSASAGFCGQGRCLFTLKLRKLGVELG